ncbi:spore germination protein B1 [Clostridium acetireducens DSM 10703]|uniref:Spore germination protein B1 n=1 Tax=Clostridium acetireducens DSM 10703 TaxID=1121290 RepID=A0A1E8EZF1_9CLOT|nr:spore germination protein [Clostridium acetireducens]OFI06540.1 spore germination protein B1 [Clostridium acetireducens DSM 10703]
MSENIKYNLQENIDYLKNEFENCSDIVFKKINIGNFNSYIVYTDGMIDEYLLTEGVLKKLSTLKSNLNEVSIDSLIPIGQITKLNSLDECIEKILSGGVVLFIKGKKSSLNIMLPKYPARSIEKPEVEPTINGPKESFTETLSTNIALIRKRLLHKECKFKEINIGNYLKSKISLAYIDSLTNKHILNEVIRRLNTIKENNLLDVSYIEELIEDNPNSIYPTMQITERPDKVVASLLEGKVAILQENSPYAIIVPCFFSDLFQSPDEYYFRYFFASFLRILRYFGYVVTCFLPAFYIAITNFNQEMLPTKLLISIQNQRSGVPFPTVLEAFLMEIAFEIMREAGARLPKAIGPAISIVGGLVIGDAAVRAGLASPAIVIVIAFTAINSFLIPSILLNAPKLYLRIISIILSGILGLWGIFIVILLNLAHMASLTSFGVPYLAPISPNINETLNNITYRPPIWNLKENRLNIFSKKYDSIIRNNNNNNCQKNISRRD